MDVSLSSSSETNQNPEKLCSAPGLTLQFTGTKCEPIVSLKVGHHCGLISFGSSWTLQTAAGHRDETPSPGNKENQDTQISGPNFPQMYGGKDFSLKVRQR